MKRIVSLSIMCSTLFASTGVIGREETGLYFDYAYIPSWRCCYPKTTLVSRVNSTDKTGNLTFGDPVLTFDEPANEYTCAMRLRGDLSANTEGSVQGIFLGQYEWEFTAKTDDNGARIGFSVDPYGRYPFGPDYTFKTFREVGFSYLEKFNSGEVSYLRPIQVVEDWDFETSILYGLRGLVQSNQLQMSGKPDPIEGEETHDLKATMRLENLNRIICFQVGGICKFKMRKKACLTIPIKLGAGGNILDFRHVFSLPSLNANPPPSHVLTTPEDIGKTRTFLSGLVEASPQLELHLKSLYVYFGGNLLYVRGVASTFKQLENRSLSDINPRGNYFLGGVFLGIGLHL